MLNELNPSLRVESKNLGSSPESILQLIEISDIVVPLEYTTLISEATDIEISVKGEMYIRLWGAESCIELNEAYKVQYYIPNSLAIGDNEGGSALIYCTGNEGFGLYITGFGDLDLTDAEFIAPSLKDLLVKGSGVETLINTY